MNNYRWGIAKKRARVQHAWYLEVAPPLGSLGVMSALCAKPSRRNEHEIDFDTTAARCEKCVKLVERDDA